MTMHGAKTHFPNIHYFELLPPSTQRYELQWKKSMALYRSMILHTAV